MYTMLTIYCIIIVIASLFGGSIPTIFKLTHRRIQLILSLVSGVMLGVALLHLLPHAIDILGSAEIALYTCLGGLLFMFFMVRMFHFHQHDLAFEGEHEHRRKNLCDQEQGRHHVHCSEHDGALDISWIGLCFGLAIHTVIDGIALAAAVQASAPKGLSLAGIGVFLAVVLHKPLDAMSITSLMAARGWNLKRQYWVNAIFSLMCPVGAVLFAMGIDPAVQDFFSGGILDPENFVTIRNAALGYALAFSAGIFLCISLGDLLPEVHFHTHDRIKLSLMLLLGVAIAFLIEIMPGHQHQGASEPAAETTAESTTQNQRVAEESIGKL